MTKTEKQEFIRQFMQSMEDSFNAKLSRVPEEWDGHELREWMADSFDQERTKLMRSSRARRKDYHNDVIIHNL